MIKSLTYVIMGKDELTPVLRKAGKEGEATGGSLASTFSKTGVVALGLATIVGGVLLKSIKDARAEGWVPLEVASKNAGLTWTKVKGQALAVGKSMQSLGFDQGQVNTSLKQLITVTGNSSLSMRALGTSADFARYKHVDLTTATNLLSSAAAGNTRALKQVGIATADLPKHFATTGTAASRMTVVMDLLNKKIGGQAAAYAGTFGGKLEVLKAQMTNVSGTVGSALLPVLSSLLSMVSSYLVPAMQAFGAWFTQRGIPAIKQWAGVIAPIVKVVLGDFFTGLKTVIKILGDMPGPMKIAGLAVIAFGLAMKLAASANPWMLLATAIIILVGLIVNNWTKIKSFTIDTFNTILHYVRIPFDWIRNNWPLLLAILTGPIGLATLAIVRNWGVIRDSCASAFNAVIGFFQGIPSRIMNAVGNLRNLLYNSGKDVIQGLWDGFTFIWNKVTGWISGLAGWIKSHKGPVSLDKTLLEPAGRALMTGLRVGLLGGFQDIKGIVTGAAGNIANWIGSAGSAIGGFFAKLFGGSTSGGVSRWAGDVAAALAMLGLPAGLASRVLYQMQTESGGNPNAINLTDSNAAAGDPSRGLLQTIMSTFLAYHVGGTSMNIYDPLANIAAAINYARARYGPSLMSGGMGMGSGHGYALGTGSAARGWAWVGERGPELVNFGGGEQVLANGAGGKTYVVNVYIQGHALASKQEIGRTVADALREFKSKGGNV